MTRQTLYAYVDGSDLENVVEALEQRLAGFVAGGEWKYRRPSVVNSRHEDEQALGVGDLPDWDLGLNVELPDPGTEPADWFSDVERIAQFLGQLHAASGRDFVIGIHDHVRGYSEDLLSVRSACPDLLKLRLIIGVSEHAP